MNITPDTNFFISSTQWKNSVANKLLTYFIENGIELYTTQGILDELRNVLKRDFKHSQDKVNEIIDYIESFVNIITSERNIGVVKDDPDDNKILECASASNSKYIISYDKHLLTLNEFEGIKIIKPEDFPKSL